MKLIGRICKKILRLAITMVLVLALYELAIWSLAGELNKDIAKDVAKHVTSFTVSEFGGAVYGTGSHVMHNGKIFILTNKHVCLAGIKYKGSKTHIEVNGKIVKIIKIWNKHDLCALESWKKIGLRLTREEAKPLDKIIVVGHPEGTPLTVANGRVVVTADLSIEIEDGKPETLEGTYISANIYPGNSGSPVTNEHGYLTGVVFAGTSGIFGTMKRNIMVPYKYVKEFLNIVAPKVQYKKELPKK